MTSNIQKGDWIRVIWKGEDELTLQVDDMNCFGMGYFGARDPEQSGMMYIIEEGANYWRVSEEEETLLTIKYGNCCVTWTACR